MTISSKEELDKILKELEGASYEVAEIKKGERTKKAPVPFTTSTLQQEASKALNFATGKTMQIAQQLYEGVDIKGNGTVGLITYLRTDSTRISDEADANVRAYIGEQYGEEYVAVGETKAKTGGKIIQDAHEAIRPTDPARTPAAIKESLTRDQFRLYQLIWKRFLASRMQPAKYETTSVKISAGKYRFTVAASKIVFQGFRLVYTEAGEEKEEQVIKELGSPEKIAKMIRDSVQENQASSEYTEEGYRQETYEDYQQMSRKDSQKEAKQGSRWHMKGRRNRNIILMILILVFVGSWLIPGIFGIVIGIAGGIFGSCAGLLFGGLGLVGAGIYKMFTTVPYGLLLMGGGFLMITGGILLLWFLVWICATAIPWIIAKIREFWNRNFGRGCE